ncbi:hypothetical protein TcWFU_006916 [Taenia crassiceps]|uniref:Uncharacterized protein n=1 Tax=Taenia crassiceps TaxID=6207 RepID=A0ABR4QEG9_9CEST
MNKYGGYAWREDERSGCYVGGFDVFNDGTFVKTIKQLKGQVKCLVLYVLVSGRLKHLIRDEEDSYRFITRSHSVLETWSKHCLQMDPILNQFFLTGFSRLTELTLNAVVQKAHNYAISGTQLYKLIYKLTEIIDAHVINNTAATLYSHRTNLFSTYHYPRGAGTVAKINNVNETSFYVEEMGNSEPLDVTCYAITAHQNYVRVISLRPISHLCFVGSFDLTSMVPEGKIEQSLECSSVKMDYRGEIEYNRGVCETIMENKKVHCQCTGHGFFFVTQVTKTSNNLKTSAPESIRLNAGLLLASIFNRIFALVGILELLTIAVSKFFSQVYKYHQNRFYPDFRNFGIVHLLINLMFLDSLSACLDQCQNAHFCQSKGSTLLAWGYMQTVISIPYGLAIVLTGKTNRLGRMLWNLTIICASLLQLSLPPLLVACITIQVVLQFSANLFLNHICMPQDPKKFIITVKAVVIFVNVLIFIHYARMRNRRYFDEWIGCMIYTLGDILDVVFGIIMVANYQDDIGKVQATFIYQYTINRSVMTLFSTTYQVFFKMSLIKFYYRVYLITVHQANLKDIAGGYENRHRIFQVISTFSEYDGTKTLPTGLSTTRLTGATDTSSLSASSYSTESSYDSSR